MGVNVGNIFGTIRMKNALFKKDLRESSRALKKFAVTGAAQVNTLGASMKRMGSKLLNMRNIIMGAGAFLILRGAIKEAAAFEKELSKVATLVDNTDQVFGEFATSIKEMSLEFGQSKETLTKGLFDIISATIDAADAMDVLRAATKLSVAGFTEAGVATSAVITMMQGYSDELRDADDASDLLFATMKRGRLTVEDVASNIGVVASVAKGAGVSVEDLSASFSSVSRSGVGAQKTVVQLMSFFNMFAKSNDDAKEAAAKLGLEMKTSAIAGGKLIPWILKAKKGLDEMTSSMKSNTIKAMMPNRRAQQAFITLLLQGEKTLDDYAQALNRVGLTQAALEKQYGKAWFQFLRFHEAIKALKEALGEGLLPFMTKATDNIADFIAEAQKSGALHQFALNVEQVAIGIAQLAKEIKLVFDIINAPAKAGAWVKDKAQGLYRKHITNAGDSDWFASEYPKVESKSLLDAPYLGMSSSLGGRAKSPSGMQQLNIGKIEGTDMEQWAEDYDLSIEKVVESMEELKEKAKELTKEVRTPFEVMEDSYGELVEMMNKEVIDEETFRRANEVLVSDYKQALKAKENLNKEFKNKLKAFNLDRIKLTESASEIQIAQFEKEAQKYDELVARGKISAEELKQFKINSINKIKLQHNRAYQTMQSSIMSWGDEFGNTLTDMVMGAEVSFSDILNSFTRMIADMAVKITIIQPMMQALFGQAAGGSGSGIVGALAGAVGTWIGGNVGTPTTTTPQSAYGGTFNPQGFPTTAEGGIVTKPTARIFGEAGPEAIIPLDRMSQVMGSIGGGGSNVEINIIGAPEGTRVEESESEQGGRSIDVILDEKMSQQVKPGSKFNNQMLSQFRDMQQSTIRR